MQQSSIFSNPYLKHNISFCKTFGITFHELTTFLLLIDPSHIMFICKECVYLVKSHH